MPYVRHYAPELGAHCIEDLRFNGVEYLAGEPFPILEIDEESRRAMWVAWRVDCGPAPDQLAKQAKRRRAELARAKAREEREAAHQRKLDAQREAQEAADGEGADGKLDAEPAPRDAG